VRPPSGAERITIYALLDSPSGTGGYEFIIRPGKETVMDVACTLFERKKIKKPGIAPLTSMFFYGENTNIRPVDDFRPEVHDSDGLMIAADTGEWIWRPLIDSKRLLVTSFRLKNPKGFGLFQRDRDFDHYQDLESYYEKRPSAWVIPGKGWGEGRVELVEIPTDNDRNDNIVAYWVPKQFPASLSYRLLWGPIDRRLPPLGRVAATRTAAGGQKGIKLYLIDFEGGRLRSLAGNAHVKAAVSVGGADLVGQQIEKNGTTGGWRLVLHVRKKEGALEQVVPPDRSVELRAALRLGNRVLTETWSYVDPF
jgi:glucans biosynthesis protein